MIFADAARGGSGAARKSEEGRESERMLRGKDPLMAMAPFFFLSTLVGGFGGPRSAVPRRGAVVLIRDEYNRLRVPVRGQFFDGGFFARRSLV